MSIGGRLPHGVIELRPPGVEGELLAQLLRSSRVTVLRADPQGDKSAFLRQSVLPLLGRRQEDRDAEASGPGIAPPPASERRAPHGAGEAAGMAEVVILFDAWSPAPLSALKAQLRDALPASAPRWPAKGSATLAERLRQWQKSCNRRFLFVFDSFEVYLSLEQEKEAIRQFADEFVEVVNDPALRANFLIAVNDDAEPLLERLRGRCPEFGGSHLRLPALRRRRKGAGNASQIGSGKGGQAGSQSAQPKPAAPNEAALAPLPAARRRRSRQPAPDVFIGPVKPATAAAPLDQARLEESPAAAAANEKWRALQDDLERQEEQQAADQGSAVVETPATAAPARKDGAEAAQEPALADEGLPAALPPEAAATGASSTTASPTGDSAKNSGAGRARPFTARRLVMPAILCLAVAAGLLAVRGQRGLPFLADEAAMAAPDGGQHAPARAATSASANAPADKSAAPLFPPGTVPAVRMELALDPSMAADAAIARELARVAAAGARIELVAQNRLPFWARGPAASQGSSSVPRLALASYEALRAAYRRKGAGDARIARIEILAPLYSEELYLLAARDSPLQHMGEIAKARINAGPPQSSLALTAARLYQAMFGRALPPEQLTAYASEEALARLARGDIDVLLLAGPQAADWLHQLPPRQAQSLKLLRHESGHGTAARATEAYLPAIVKAGSYGDWPQQDMPTLATMTFLVGVKTDDEKTGDKAGGHAGERRADEHLRVFAGAWCRGLPELRRLGHSKWHEVQPGMVLDAGWPYSAAARSAIASCLAEQAGNHRSKNP